VVALLILGSTVNVLRGAFTILMEGVPAELPLETVGREMAHVEGVRSVHDLHIWTLSSGRVVLSAHLELEDLGRWPQILGRMRAMLREHYGIEHVTLQPEVTPHIEQPYQAKVTIHPTQR
jgi:cobalt-zinc-cadmium efflux system protein